MIPNQGRWLAVVLCALLGASGCAEGTQQPRPPNPIVGASAGKGAAGAGGSAAAAGAPGPRAGAGGASTVGPAGGANAGGRGGTGASMDAGLPKPGADDAGIDDEASDAGLDDPDVEEWLGTTSQGLDMNFDVSEAGLTRLRLQYAFPPVCDGDNSTDFDPPAPLGDPFSVSFVLAGATNATFAGTFANDGRASGTLTFMSTLMAGQPACGVGVVTWNATRQ